MCRVKTVNFLPKYARVSASRVAIRRLGWSPCYSVLPLFSEWRRIAVMAWQGGCVLALRGCHSQAGMGSVLRSFEKRCAPTGICESFYGVQFKFIFCGIWRIQYAEPCWISETGWISLGRMPHDLDRLSLTSADRCRNHLVAYPVSRTPFWMMTNSRRNL